MARIHRMGKLLVCFGLLLAFLGCTATHNTESTGQYVDDSVITSKVKTAILNEPSLKVFEISVETYKGEVQLSGFVAAPQSVSMAGDIAAKIDGVRSVKNDLLVK